MKIKNTAAWLQEYTINKKNRLQDNLQIHAETLCQPLAPYFQDTDAHTIQHHLIQHGMFYPDPIDKQVIKQIIAKNYWERVRQQLQTLEKLWSKQEGTLFIFPSDFTNPQLLKQFNGVSGLSFTDKLFLFITDQTTEIQLQVLLTHEYSHICRLQHFSALGLTFTLADAIVLEGIAEAAVKELIGERYCSPWVHLYSKAQLADLWKEWIQPNIDVSSTCMKHYALMYGTEEIPQWAGYAVGYDVIDHYIKKYNISTKQLITTPTKEILTSIDHL
ncbi:DUF2268 domain-containing protein [Paraliobacillus sp. JSM ZJ581]|uniref:DUF2268 domain-containing protein n=1 Tax=Paraliobacillus sp. JSM ZJ581 TaxID=3342118 RepID=UPI0035A9A2AA